MAAEDDPAAWLRANPDAPRWLREIMRAVDAALPRPPCPTCGRPMV